MWKRTKQSWEKKNRINKDVCDFIPYTQTSLVVFFYTVMRGENVKEGKGGTVKKAK